MSYPYYNNLLGSPQLYPADSITYQPQTVSTEVIKVNGISGAYQCALPPGTRSILVTDTEKLIVYLITTDGVNRNVQAYDISLHQEPVQHTNDSLSDNTNLEQVLKSINDKLTNLEGEVNELKSNCGGTSTEAQSHTRYNKSSNGSNAGSHPNG